MTSTPRDTDQDDTGQDQPTPDAADGSAGRDPRDTSHPTGEKQAAENAENEPVA